MFNFDSTAKMDASDEEIVQMALKQVERTMKDLSERSSQGYAIGYELGYIKGVLEHVLKTRLTGQGGLYERICEWLYPRNAVLIQTRRLRERKIQLSLTSALRRFLTS